MTLGEKIKELREELGMSKRALHLKVYEAHYSNNNIKEIEENKQFPYQSTMLRIAAVLDPNNEHKLIEMWSEQKVNNIKHYNPKKNLVFGNMHIVESCNGCKNIKGNICSAVFEPKRWRIEILKSGINCHSANRV